MNLSGWQGNFLPSVPAVIPQSDTRSQAINAKGMALVGLIFPSILTGTAISFEVGDSADGFQANGEVLFGSNPADSDTLTINGVVITFKTSVTIPASQVAIGIDAATTMANLKTFLDATAVAGLLACTYSLNAGDTLLTVTAIVHGTAGNAYTFLKSSTHITLTPSGGVLSGGGFRALYDSSNAVISYTVAAGRAYVLPAATFENLQWFKLKSGSTELNSRTIICSLKGI